MRKNVLRLSMAVLLGAAVLGWSPLTAGADDSGRPDGTSAGTPSVEAPDAGGSDVIRANPDWDGDGPAPRPFITTNANNSIGGSLCVGFDCVANEAFGFDTLRLKENNLRIHFQDTSTIAGFPTRDWRIFANSSASGGGDFFSINDVDAGFDAFRIDGDSLANALTIDAQGDVGLGLRPAALDLHIRRGDTPSIRLEQDGSSGFTPQTFDVAGNEAGFFVRDATSGSTLPLRIRPGAPSSALDIAADGDIGIGTGSPAERLDIQNGSTNQTNISLEEPSTGSPVDTWLLGVRGNDNGFQITRSGSGNVEFEMDEAGNATFAGTVTATVGGTNHDLVGEITALRADNDALRAQNAAMQAQLNALQKLVDALVAAQN